MRRIPDTDRVRIGLREAITLLCKTGLTFESELSIEGLLGITLDQNEVFLVNIKEVIKNPMDFHVSSSENTPENQDCLVRTTHSTASESKQVLNCAEYDVVCQNEPDVDDKSEAQCLLNTNEWTPSNCDETSAEFDFFANNRATASVATTTQGHSTFQVKPMTSHVWDETGAGRKTSRERSLNLKVQQQSEKSVAQRQSHMVDPFEGLGTPLTVEEDNTWQSTIQRLARASHSLHYSTPAMPINLTQKHKLPSTKPVCDSRPVTVSPPIDQQADTCEEVKPKRCRIEKINHSATFRDEGRSPDHPRAEDRPKTLTTNSSKVDGSLHTWLPSVSISEGSSEVIIVKEEHAESPELINESQQSSPANVIGRDWLNQRTDGAVLSSSILSPYNEPDAHARWLQNIAAHVQGLRGPAFRIPGPSIMQTPRVSSQCFRPCPSLLHLSTSCQYTVNSSLCLVVSRPCHHVFGLHVHLLSLRP